MKQRQQVSFNALEFHRTHGHMPRGRALWVFYFSDDPEEPWLAGQKRNKLGRRTYQDSKRMATDEAKRRGVTSVRVDPHPL